MYDVTQYSSINLNKTFQPLSVKKKKRAKTTNACQIRTFLNREPTVANRVIDRELREVVGLGTSSNRIKAFDMENLKRRNQSSHEG